jgi:hypothetical protein
MSYWHPAGFELGLELVRLVVFYHLNHIPSPKNCFKMNSVLLLPILFFFSLLFLELSLE